MTNGKIYYDLWNHDVIDWLLTKYGKASALTFCEGNIMKYITRLGKKNTPIKEDMEKIRNYADRWLKIYDEWEVDIDV